MEQAPAQPVLLAPQLLVTLGPAPIAGRVGRHRQQGKHAHGPDARLLEPTEADVGHVAIILDQDPPAVALHALGHCGEFRRDERLGAGVGQTARVVGPEPLDIGAVLVARGVAVVAYPVGMRPARHEAGLRAQRGHAPQPAEHAPGHLGQLGLARRFIRIAQGKQELAALERHVLDA